MKLLVIPDIHGILDWKSQVAEAIMFQDTHIVFVGDYVDSFIADGWMILENLRDIIEFKRKYPEKITLLLGNHDYAYIYGKPGISGFNQLMWFEYKRVFDNNRDLFEVAWGFQGKERYTLITHAGLTNSFYNNVVKEINDPESVMHDILVKNADEPWDKMPLHKLLNYFIDQVRLMWQIGYYRNGADATGSILWADRHELMDNRFKGIDQIVGHTALPYVQIRNIEDDKLYFIDTHNEFEQTLTGFMIDLT